MPTEIDVRVTPSLHETIITSLDGYDAETAPVMAPVVEAFSDAYISLGKLHDLRDVVAKNQAWTEAQQILLVTKEADKQQGRLCKKFDGLHTILTKQVASYEEQLTQPMKEKAGMGSLNSEVRAHAKALPRDERKKMVERAFEANDTDTLHALLGAQPFLSGLMPEEHSFYVRQFHEMTNPAVVKRLTVTRAALNAVHERAPLLFGQIEKVLGMPRDKIVQIEKANTAALEALKFGG
jgi:hypothetical protein